MLRTRLYISVAWDAWFWHDGREFVCSGMVGHMSLITSALPKANLNNNNNVEANKYVPALYVHSQEVGKPSRRGLHLLLKVCCWLRQSFKFPTYKYAGGWGSILTLSFHTDIALRSPFFHAESRHISYTSLYCSNCTLQVVLDCCSQYVKCFCVWGCIVRQRLLQYHLFAGKCWCVSLRIPLI
jgi:hypothetical protein